MEILRALFRGAKVLVLDEPTAVLTAQESQDLFKVLRTLTEDGTSVVFISHKLNEVLDIADRVTVLRRGKKIDTVPTEGATERSLATLMVGRDVLLRVDKPEHTPGEPVLEVRDLHVVDDRGLPAVRGLTFEVRAGEIVGLAGVDANGQSELIEAITGLRTSSPASVLVDGRDVTGDSAREMIDAGVGHIAEDRHRRGLVLQFDLAENLALLELPQARHVALGLAVAADAGRSRARPAAGVRRARRRDRDARLVAVGRQPAEGRHRARDVGRPEGADRRAADARARRRRDRVRAPPARRGARQGPRDPARSRSSSRRSARSATARS